MIFDNIYKKENNLYYRKLSINKIDIALIVTGRNSHGFVSRTNC